MARVPQELINAIIDETNDAPTLGSCALASSRTREHSQRRLFKITPLRLRDRGYLYQKAIVAAPHLAAYTEILVIQTRKHWVDRGQDGEDENKILSHLSNVRTCILNFSRDAGWSHFQLKLKSVILSFLQRQRPLDEIHILGGRMEVREFAELLASARASRVSFHYSSFEFIRHGNPPSIEKDVPSPPFLALPRELGTIALELLARSGFFRNTLHLSITLDRTSSERYPQSFGRILQLASESGTLRRLTLVVYGRLGEESELATMDLPNIEYLDFSVQQSTELWTFLAITALLEREPTTRSLRRITLTSWGTWGEYIVSQPSEAILRRQQSGVSQQKAIENLDKALASRAPLQLLFRLDGTPNVVQAAKREITRNMPLSAALGLITFENYLPPTVLLDRSDWRVSYYDPWGYI
ncbi:hypothetical protein MKEN_00722200 [Mycena kentingensis (nom. inval.)]|nr:hypothetical protein MKEN_00722200 [Mycena kentingensis (nom. inval.)]